MYLEWSMTIEWFVEAGKVVHLSSVKYNVGGLSFMDGRSFVGISVLKRERKLGMKGNIMEMLQTLSFDPGTSCKRFGGGRRRSRLFSS
jgi:hypothetical protein